MSTRKIRLGMVGGGQGAFIGATHRIAARLDDHYVLTAGALSSDPENARASGAELGLGPERSYESFADMAQTEAGRQDGIEAVSVVTPNHLHHAVCKVFLENGVDVICNKPRTTTLSDAKELLSLARRHERLLGVTYTYTGYPMVREARALIEGGALGAIRLVLVEFAIGWLSTPLERDGDSKQAA